MSFFPFFLRNRPPGTPPRPAPILALAAAAGLAAAAAAQSAQPGAPPSAQRPASAAAAPDASAMVAAGLPKYDPPKPAPAVPEDQQPDLRDIDKPRNEIVRLPQYLVHPPKSPILRQSDTATRQGQAALAMRQHPGLDWVPLGFMNQGVALGMYQEGRRLQDISDLNDAADMMKRGGDAREGEYIRRETQDTYLRGFDWGGPVPQK